MITGLDHVAIAVQDFRAAVDQYTRLLGRSPSGLDQRAAMFTLRNARILLLAAASEQSPEGLSGLGLLTLDAQACAQQLTAAGFGCSADPQRARSFLLHKQHSGGLAVRLVERDGTPLPAADSFSGEQVEALDHVVIRSAALDRCVTFYNGALGIRLALDREVAGMRMLFFRTGGVTLEVIADASAGNADVFYGLAYRARDLAATHARLTAAGFALTELRPGRKPNTHVFSVRTSICGVPTLFIRDASRD